MRNDELRRHLAVKNMIRILVRMCLMHNQVSSIGRLMDAYLDAKFYIAGGGDKETAIARFDAAVQP